MVRKGNSGGNGGVPAADELLDFATASSTKQPQKIAAARDRLLAKLGPEAVVDAAAVIGNFERMTRIADGTGIPLDAPVNALASDIQDDLGLRTFRSSAATKKAGGVARVAAKLLGPLVLRMMPVVANRVRRAETDK
jgi:DNA-binding phage protein